MAQSDLSAAATICILNDGERHLKYGKERGPGFHAQSARRRIGEFNGVLKKSTPLRGVASAADQRRGAITNRMAVSIDGISGRLEPASGIWVRLGRGSTPARDLEIGDDRRRRPTARGLFDTPGNSRPTPRVAALCAQA